MMSAALHPKPWYREPWPWFLMSLPAIAVVAGVTTLVIAIKSADGMVVGDYYKAGLAINQTLERDDVAHALALTATIKTEDGTLLLALAGRMPSYPEQLSLTLAHPTRSGMDQTLAMHHEGGGHYRAALPAMPNEMARPAGRWRIHLAADRRRAYAAESCRHTLRIRIHRSTTTRETEMKAVLDLLFTSGIGLLSLFTIFFIIGMGIFMVKLVKRKMNEPEE